MNKSFWVSRDSGSDWVDVWASQPTRMRLAPRGNSYWYHIANSAYVIKLCHKGFHRTTGIMVPRGSAYRCEIKARLEKV